MNEIPFKAEFIARIKEVHQDQGLRWLKRLPPLISSLEKCWGFQFISPVDEISYGFVARVLYKNGEAVLKMSPDPEIIKKECLWLSEFPEVTPKIFERDLQKGAFLMEKINPGSPLKHMVKNGEDEKATRILCELVRKMQSHSFRSSAFPHLAEHKHISLLHGHFDKDLVTKAESLYRDLTMPSSSDIVLHGDFHHDNILSDHEGWKIIDPHGYIGDPVFEIAPMMYNPLDVLPHISNLSQVLIRRIEIIAEEMPYDRKRIEAWAFCMNVLSMAWRFEGTNKVPEFESRTARILSSLV